MTPSKRLRFSQSSVSLFASKRAITPCCATATEQVLGIIATHTIVTAITRNSQRIRSFVHMARSILSPSFNLHLRTSA